MTILYLDFETRSRCDLLTQGAYNYARHPSTTVLCMSYTFDNEDVQTWDGDDKFPARVRNHKGLIYAHNAAFERLICRDVLELDYRLDQFYCTAVQAAANCAPRSLEDIGRFTSSNMRKDHKGKALIKKLCVPRADGTFNNDPDLLKEMIAYCEQDVWTMRAVSKMLRPLTAEELADYHTNERINDRGVLLDKPLAEAAVKYAEAEVVEIQQIVKEVTNGEITSVRSPKMKEWVRVRVGPIARGFMKVAEDGEEKFSLDKTVRANLLALADENEYEVPHDVAEVIQCADDLWSSSVAKFNRLASLADDDDCRVRGAFVFNGGSATGRACVSALSLVETPNGPTPISMLPIGGEVLTHKGRFCKVSRVIYKGRQMMYRVTTHAGGWIECTEEHMLLTNKGWTNVKELISHTQLESARGGDAPVFLTALPYDGRGWAFNSTDARYGVCNRAGDHTAGSTTHPESGELFEIQDGREEPYVWSAETGRSHTTEGLPVSLAGGQHLCAGAPFSGNGGNGADGVARGVGNTPHRRGQTEQSGGQFGGGDEGGASTFAQTTVKEIVRVGEKGVWDITVEGDASYCAQGLIHHNSSYGAQVHNFPRKSHNDALNARESIIQGAPIVPKYGKRVTDVLKQMLRPALIPAAGKKLVVADWSSIEARVTPWMTDTLQGEKKLELFASGADVYKHNAAATFGVRPDEVNDHQRQVGKVQELACLAEDTMVLTSNGVKAIVEVTLNDLLWDGEEWVAHQGLVFRGQKQTINVCGISATPDHLFLVANKWHEAKQLASSPNLTFRALETGLVSLPSWGLNTAPQAAFAQPRCNAPAALSRTMSTAITYARAHLQGVGHALENSLATGAKIFFNTPTLAPMTRTADGFSIAYPLAKTDATTPMIRVTLTMVDGASGYTSLGARTKRPFCDMLRSWRGGTNRILSLIALTTTKGMSLIISGLYRTKPTLKTNGQSNLYNSKCESLRNVYDIAHAGPRNRFTVMSERGAMIVHNCGFGGGVGAFANMARVYNLTLTEAESQRMVDAWRRANVWGPIYWSLLEQAYHRAMRNKGREITAGRVTYLFDGVHLWYALPSGRVLCYPHARFDGDGSLSYAKAAWKPAQDAREWPRARLWKGLACENITQAVANDLLRHTLRQVDAVLHVHDEVVLEASDPEQAADHLKRIMTTPPTWAVGLPLAAEVKIMGRYGK